MKLRAFNILSYKRTQWKCLLPTPPIPPLLGHSSEKQTILETRIILWMLPFTHLSEPSLTFRLYTPEKNIFQIQVWPFSPSRSKFLASSSMKSFLAWPKPLLFFKGYPLPPWQNPIPGYRLRNSLPRKYTWRYAEEKSGPVQSELHLREPSHVSLADAGSSNYRPWTLMTQIPWVTAQPPVPCDHPKYKALGSWAQAAFPRAPCVQSIIMKPHWLPY